MGTRPYDNRHFKNLDFSPKIFRFFRFFPFFPLFKNSISPKFLPQKKASELLKTF